MDNMLEAIRKEVFDALEKCFVRGFDDFHNCWTINIEDYIKIKRFMLNDAGGKNETNEKTKTVAI